MGFCISYMLRVFVLYFGMRGLVALLCVYLLLVYICISSYGCPGLSVLIDQDMPGHIHSFLSLVLEWSAANIRIA